MCTLQRWHEEHAAGKRSWGDSAQLRASCMNLKPHEIAVMVVFDGRLKASKTIFEGETAVLTPAHRDAMAEAVKPMNDNPRPAHSDVREAHIFEMDYIAERSRGELANCPLNLIFCIKEKNGGKLNSHVWFFRCFSPLLRPRYCVLLDAGTVPDPTAILHLYADMEENVHIGGCAGEICVDPSQQNVFDLGE
jgi:cellulose synthase/poly-beta-1,6-N-acetylglucosamine synthase-like glycosyltransferase